MIRHFKRALALVIGVSFLISCRNDALSHKLPSSFEDFREVQFLNPRGDVLNVRIAIGPYETSLGLSGVHPENFKDNQGLFFFFHQEEDRVFWMPDTYFNLDIIFLDENLKVVHLEKNFPFHPGRSERPPIPRTPVIKCRYVLEIKAGSQFGRVLNKGDNLVMRSEYSLDAINSFILKNYN